MKRWRLVVAAALGVGAASCGDRSLAPNVDAGRDFALPTGQDFSQPGFTVAYGPAETFFDLSGLADGGTE